MRKDGHLWVSFDGLCIGSGGLSATSGLEDQWSGDTVRAIFTAVLSVTDFSSAISPLIRYVTCSST